LFIFIKGIDMSEQAKKILRKIEKQRGEIYSTINDLDDESSFNEVEEAALTGQTIYNENTKTWWIDLHPNEEKSGCNPACVVSEATKTAEINWRCTGAVPE
jgi:DNA-binding PucR family transcriptional regulator